MNTNNFPSLSQQDKNFLAEYINTYSSSFITSPKQIEKILSQWREAKSQYLFSIFGDQLIHSTEVEYSFSPEQLAQNFQFSSEEKEFICALTNLFCYNPNFRPYVQYLSYFVSIENLITNRWMGETISLPLPNNRSFKIDRNTKMMRILNKLSKEYHLPFFDTLRKHVAEISTNKSVKTTLYVSIHPLDYLTMSDNAENWHSCMSWINAGTYKCGTIEMMNSPKVVVAYTINEDNKLLDYWNSKSWRNLIILDEDHIAGTRCYPFCNEILTKAAEQLLADLANQKGIFSYGNTFHTGTRNRHTKYIEVAATPNKTFLFNYETNNMYNDMRLGKEAEHTFLLANKLLERPEEKIILDVNYSGPLTCATCGRIIDDDDLSTSREEEGTVNCPNCAPDNYLSMKCCCNCGNSYEEEDLHETRDGLVCETCFCNFYEYCIDIDEYVNINDLGMIFIVNDEGEQISEISLYDNDNYIMLITDPKIPLNYNEYNEGTINYRFLKRQFWDKLPFKYVRKLEATYNG